MNRPTLISLAALALGVALPSCLAQSPVQIKDGDVINGFTVSIPESSIPQSGRIHTNYFIAKSDNATPDGPPPGTETPGSVACVYKLVKGPAGCPVATSTAVPTGGWGAIAIVDAGSYPTAASDLQQFSTYFGIPDADLQIVYSGQKPPVYAEWLLEQALDIEWAHAMAPQAKLFLVESDLSDTDPTFQAVKLAGKLVAENGGGEVSMSWGIPEFAQETKLDPIFTQPGVVFFAASGDSGLNVSIHPAASINVVAVGGTQFNRNASGDFVSESYGGGGGDLSPYEPIPAYQSVIQNIVGTHRGYPDVASDFCCAGVVLEGSWTAVGGTSWSSPTFAGIVNAAGHKAKSSDQELTAIYTEYTNSQEYQAAFYDITEGSSYCVVGWDLCAGVGTPRTYRGK